MSGLHAGTGRSLSGIDHIRQSCRDILTTMIGTRIERREYGSLLPELIDHPHNEANNLRCMAATVMALARWEPRISIRKVSIYIGTEAGLTLIDMDAVTADGPRTGSAIALNIPIGGLR